MNEKRHYIWRSHWDKQKRIVVDLSDHVLDNWKTKMSYTKIELKALLDEAKAKVMITDVAAKQAWVQAHLNVLLKYIEIQVQVQLQK